MEMVSGSWCGASAGRSAFARDGRGYMRLLSPAGHVGADDRASMQSGGKASDGMTDRGFASF